MPCQLKNKTKMNLESLEPHVQGMYDFFDQKIGFNKPPTMVFNSDLDNKAEVLGKTAYYDPQTFEVHVFVDGRHPKDLLRSIAHELIHHRQNLEGRLDVGGYMGEGYYLENEKMRELEQEAMLDGNSLMREYEDNFKYRENKEMSLKQWKNNELNENLLIRFGILKESYNESQEEIQEMKDEKMYENEEEEGQEDEEMEMDEGRGDPRGENADKFVGHEDRYQADRIHEIRKAIKTIKDFNKSLTEALKRKGK